MLQWINTSKFWFLRLRFSEPDVRFLEKVFRGRFHTLSKGFQSPSSNSVIRSELEFCKNASKIVDLQSLSKFCLIAPKIIIPILKFFFTKSAIFIRFRGIPRSRKTKGRSSCHIRVQARELDFSPLSTYANASADHQFRRTRAHISTNYQMRCCDGALFIEPNKNARSTTYHNV